MTFGKELIESANEALAIAEGRAEPAAVFVPEGIAAADTRQEHEVLEALWKEMGHLKGDRQAVRENLAAGVPVYYREEDTPQGLQIKEYPDGRRELVKFSRSGDTVIQKL